MTTPETAAEIALDILEELAGTGADPRGPDGSGAAWTVGAHGTEQQKGRLQRIEAAAYRKHGAQPGAKLGNAPADTTSTKGMDALDRALAKAFDLRSTE